MDVSKYFKKSEFDCVCCGVGGDEIDPRLLLVADEVRKRIGPMVLNSGYRCQEHNALIGSSEASQHRQKTAGDFTLARRSDRTPINMARLYILFEDVARRHLNGYGIGLYNTFVHFDVREERSRWSKFDWPKLRQ
jgi:uncharacterized protein YcbK (DUF882 family)